MIRIMHVLCIFSRIYRLFTSVFMIISNDSYNACVCVMCMGILCKAVHVCLMILVPTAKV